MRRKKAKIVIVDPDSGVRDTLASLLENRLKCDVERLETASALRELLKTVPPTEQPYLIFISNKLPDADSIEFLAELKDTHSDVPLRLVLLSEIAEARLLISAVHAGASEFLLKPVSEEQLVEVAESLLKSMTTTDEILPVQAPPTETLIGAGERPIIGRSPEMLQIYKLIGQVARSNASVLIHGYSGTGKELVARAIHEYSDRRNCPFVAINCASIPATLLESELFGHERGAFTGAESRHIGKFEYAHTGTILLDEVGDMSLATQAKVLRVLQEQTFERLGGNETIKVNVRVIAATNRSLVEAMNSKQFRVDLFYRLKGIYIYLPPLCQRGGDLKILTSFFIDKYSREMNKRITGLSTSALKKLESHNWPGNVRELENVIEAAVIRCDGEQLLEHHIVIDKQSPHSDSSLLTPEVLAARLDSIRFAELASQLEGHLLDSYTVELHRGLIKACLEYCNYNQVQAARILGISRNTLRAKINQLAL